MEWNEAIFDSFRAGFLKSPDCALCVSLKLSTSERTYRRVDKWFYHESDRAFDLKGLRLRVHIGLSRRYEGNARPARRLRPAIDELTGVTSLETIGEEERYQKSGKTWAIRSPAGPPSPLAQELVARGVAASTAAELVRRRPPDDRGQAGGLRPAR